MPSLSDNVLTVAQFPCLSDNYGFLIHCESTGQTAAIDTPEASAYKNELKRRGWKLTHIFNTHHHLDHTGGNLELKSDGVLVYGPSSEKIPGMDVGLKGGDEIEFGGTKAHIIDVGGHTLGHLSYHFPKENIAFVGDSLFALGCGKMFEGSPSQFWGSLKRLRELPDDTTIYCAHEYTSSNAKFALAIEPGNSALVSRAEEIKATRERGEPTVPSNLGVEKQTNPFLRCDMSAEIRQNIGVKISDSDADVFGRIRKAKDKFRG
jgi:hydroxyacylglutathione hydrolase